ncbi:class I adenylate-forming enzyme family protein [Amycolatopsis saalfeldensis]|uniref:Fatty-acyl-CoA synthase n=1 Tax=Amycolatopsis saalfeldensis TaxID=394193 RepID=A0A1H8U151_9PSEU|nr:class I adenylate-forming enzyme family protein [Amycolatopsis saalfeldensis]SEO96847.1 fatty-acyl-CoA synthase [Amycolatopsis saalfeldensis]
MELSFTLLSVLQRCAFDPRIASRPAFTQSTEGTSFAQLHQDALRLADSLRRWGIGAGDRVAVLMGNRLAWAGVLFGVVAAGAVCVPVNVLLAGTEIRAVLAQADARALILDDSAGLGAGDIAGLRCPVITVGGTGELAYAELLAAGDPDRPAAAVKPGDPVLRYYTSGTTGPPKAIVHTHQGVLWNTQHQIADLQLSPDDVYLVVPSFSWAAGWHHLTLAHLWHGGRSEILPTGPDTLARVVDAVGRAGITRAFLAPTVLKQLLARPDLLERLRGSSLTRVTTGAEPLPANVPGRLAAAVPGCAVTQAYGMTEMPLIAAAIRPEEVSVRPASTGRASAVTTLAVKKRDGTISPTGEGEILLKSPALAYGHGPGSGADEDSRRTGWFHTGDEGTLDAEGFLTVSGRVKDLVISGGINIYPAEIEEVILSCAGVAEAAVVGIPDERWGERPAAVVVERARGAVDERQVRDRCARELSKFKQPGRIVLRTEPLPRTVTGKVLKREVREWFSRAGEQEETHAG